MSMFWILIFSRLIKFYVNRLLITDPKCPLISSKSCRKRLPVFSPFSTMFSNVLSFKTRKTFNCLVKVYRKRAAYVLERFSGFVLGKRKHAKLSISCRNAVQTKHVWLFSYFPQLRLNCIITGKTGKKNCSSADIS